MLCVIEPRYRTVWGIGKTREEAFEDAYKRIEADDDVQVFDINGLHIRNGRKDAVTFASTELIANPDLCTNADAKALRAAFGGTITEAK